MKGLCINWCQNEILEITCVLVNGLLFRNDDNDGGLICARRISSVNKPHFLLIFKYLESRNFTSVNNNLNRMY